jgi:hypothetical protein
MPLSCAPMRKIHPTYILAGIFLLLLLIANVALFMGYDDWLPKQQHEGPQ